MIVWFCLDHPGAVILNQANLQWLIHIPIIYDESNSSVPFCYSRLNISTIGHVGWEFLTPEPCISGITRKNVTTEYSGIYDLTLKDNQQREDEQVTYVTVIQGKYTKHKLLAYASNQYKPIYICTISVKSYNMLDSTNILCRW